MLTVDLSRSELESVIDEWIIGHHAERNRALMKRRYIDGICFEPLAEEFGLSVSQTKRIIYKLENKIIKHL